MPPALPTGTVTFLFTDVEGSTRLLHELGAAGYADALAEHRRIVREACTSQGGVEVDPEDLAECVAIHRDVWEPSRVNESSYRNVMAEWPCRGSLDCVVEAPDGRFASYVLVWPDDENGVGLFEPVGTRAEFRRRGLGAAVCTFGLRRLHEEGMRRAIVGCDTEPACALYESLGFRRSWTITSYAR